MRHNTKIINLITTNNKLHSNYLSKMNFSVNEFPVLICLEELEKNIKPADKNYTLLELTDETLIDYKKFKDITDFLYNNTKLICITDKLLPAVEETLIKCGIADCLCTTDSTEIVSYINVLDQRENSKNGKFLILDDNTAHIKILNSIIKRFGYKTEFIQDGESLYAKCAEKQTEMVLVNLGTKNLDLNSIIRKSYANSDIKKNPLICYKCMDEGLFVHELISGLNKITKVILTPFELYSFLTDTLFKKEIISASSKLNKAVKFDKYKKYSTESLSQIYYSIQENLDSQESLFKDETVNNMINHTRIINKTVVKMKGLKWLNNNNREKLKKTTCGVGA